MIPLAVAGSRPLTHVDASGYLHDVDGTRLEWWILGDDQWHAPVATASLRQASVEHTPVIETTIRVPGGDVVWRVGAAVDGVILECENRAAIPVAIGLALVDHFNIVRDLEVFPVTHGTTWRRTLDDYTKREIIDLASVVRGWQALARQGASITTTDPAYDDALMSARISVLLHQGALVAKGKKADRAIVAATNDALELLGYEDQASELRVACKLKPRRGGLPIADLDVPPASVAPDDLGLLADPIRAAHSVIAARNLLARESNDGIDVLPGFKEAWRGLSIDVANLPTNHGPISFALRWHGDKPALLWKSPVPLTASALSPSFSSSEAKGEQLL